jgi:hypothetical protein
VQLERGGEKLKWRELAGRPVREKAQRETVLKAVRTASKPAADHPWRMQRVGSVRAALKRRGGVWASPGLMDTLEGRCAWGF